MSAGRRVASYPSVAAFYNAERRRLTSRESDVGLWWRDEPCGPVWRAAWVLETGELYLVRLGPSEDGGGRVEVLGVFEDAAALERALGDWRARCGQAGSLSWLRGRALRRRAVPLRIVAATGVAQPLFEPDPEPAAA